MKSLHPLHVGSLEQNVPSPFGASSGGGRKAGMSCMTQVVVLLHAYADVSTHIIIIAAFIPDPKTQIHQVIHPLAVSDFTRTPRDDAAAMALSQARYQCTDDRAVEGPPGPPWAINSARGLRAAVWADQQFCGPIMKSWTMQLGPYRVNAQISNVV